MISRIFKAKKASVKLIVSISLAILVLLLLSAGLFRASNNWFGTIEKCEGVCREVCSPLEVQTSSRGRCSQDGEVKRGFVCCVGENSFIKQPSVPTASRAGVCDANTFNIMPVGDPFVYACAVEANKYIACNKESGSVSGPLDACVVAVANHEVSRCCSIVGGSPVPGISDSELRTPKISLLLGLSEREQSKYYLFIGTEYTFRLISEGADRCNATSIDQITKMPLLKEHTTLAFHDDIMGNCNIEIKFKPTIDDWNSPWLIHPENYPKNRRLFEFIVNVYQEEVLALSKVYQFELLLRENQI